MMAGTYRSRLVRMISPRTLWNQTFFCYPKTLATTGRLHGLSKTSTGHPEIQKKKNYFFNHCYWSATKNGSFGETKTYAFWTRERFKHLLICHGIKSTARY